ncbi:N-6 DNA methylase [Amycolatopsis sp. Hca4]|nr:N-6 DNA methylase [Amycolatopsis sp. Hca4]
MSTSEPTFDSRALRKALGAFFTPSAFCDYVVDWAVHSPDDRVLEPACGEAAFLLSAGRRLAKLAADQGTHPPHSTESSYMPRMLDTLSHWSRRRGAKLR